MISPTFFSRIEPLESRIAPAALVAHLAPAVVPQEGDPGDGDSGPSLSVGNSDNIATSVAHGGTIVYTITYQNTGDTTATNAVLTDFLDAHTTFNSFQSDAGWSGSGTQFTFSIGSLPADGPHTTHFAVTVAANLPTSVRQLDNSAALSADSTGSISMNDSTRAYQGIIATTPGISAAGKFPISQINVVDIATGEQPFAPLHPYPSTVRDSVRVTLGDINSDGFDDLIVSTEHGKGAVKVFDGATGNEMTWSALDQFQPFGAKTGAFVAAGNLGPVQFAPLVGRLPLADGHDDLAFGSSLGGGAVRVVNGETGANLEPVFYPFGTHYHGGVRVAIGDVDGDGSNDLIVAQGNFGNQVKVYSGGDSAQLLVTITVGGAHYTGGLNVTAGDIDGDGRAEIVTGRNRLSDPAVEVFEVNSGEQMNLRAPGPHPAFTVMDTFTRLGGFDAFNKSFQGGVRVALADVNHDGVLDFITGAGYGGGGKVNIFDGSPYALRKLTLTPTITIGGGTESNPTLLGTGTAFPDSPSSAVWVAGSTPVPSVPQQMG